MKRLLPFVLMVATATACAGTGHQLSPSVLGAPTTTVAVAAPSQTPSTPGCTEGMAGTVAASHPPLPALPAPGQMPAGSYMSAIEKRGKLVGATSPDQLLFGYVNPVDGNQVEGLDADLLRYVAAAIFGGNPVDPTVGGHLQIKTITLAQRIPDIQDGSADLVADTMTINCARRLVVDFSSVYYDAGQTVLVRSDSTATKIEDLSGKRVCSALKSTSLDNLAKVPGVIPVGRPDQSDCLVAFEDGAVDAISTDDTVLAGLASQDPYAKVVGPRFTDEPYGIAISLKHPDFTAFVNAVLARMRADGSLAGLYAKWLGGVLKPLPAVPVPKYTGL